jgi:sulfatase maturation enzyme AslB (radical SAM superfamily)
MQLQLETSAVCNARCVFCPYPTMKRKHGFMDMDLFRKIIDEAATMPLVDHITLTGLGEPLMDEHLVERIKYIRSKVQPEVMITAFSNGTFLTEQMARDLCKAGLTVLYVSINALDHRRRKAIMKLDDYDVVEKQCERAIQIFAEEGDGQQRVVVKAIITKDLFEPGEPDEFIKKWGGEWNKGGSAFIHMEGNWAGAMWPVRVTPTSTCHRAIGEIMVLQDGRVSICCFDGEGQYILGDLNKQTIREMYNDPNGEAWKFRNAHAEGRRGELKLCSTCTAI